MNFWDHRRACFLEKFRIIAGDVTIVTKKIKPACADRVSVGLSYAANLEWHMPICVERCRAEQKYMSETYN